MPVARTTSGTIMTCDGCGAPLERINHDTMVFECDEEVRKQFAVPPGATLSFVVCEPIAGRPSCLEKARTLALAPIEAGPLCPCAACLRRRREQNR